MSNTAALPTTAATSDTSTVRAIQARAAAGVVILALAINGALPVLGKAPLGTWSIDRLQAAVTHSVTEQNGDQQKTSTRPVSKQEASGKG